MQAGTSRRVRPGGYVHGPRRRPPGRPAARRPLPVDTGWVHPNHPAAPDPAVATPPTPTAAAVVLAGGASQRWGGRDKTAALLAGRPVLSHVLNGLPPGIAVAVVGPSGHPAIEHLVIGQPPIGQPPIRRPAVADPLARVDPAPRWIRERPPGGGPVAGLAAGIAALPDTVDVVIVLAGDLPFAGPAGARLGTALAVGEARSVGRDPTAPDAVIGRDPTGRDQPLVAAYRLAPLRAALGPPATVAGRSMRSVVAGLRTVRAPVSAREAFDLDTPQALATAEALLATADSDARSCSLP